MGLPNYELSSTALYFFFKCTKQQIVRLVMNVY